MGEFGSIVVANTLAARVIACADLSKHHYDMRDREYDGEVSVASAEGFDIKSCVDTMNKKRGERDEPAARRCSVEINGALAVAMGNAASSLAVCLGMPDRKTCADNVSTKWNDGSFLANNQRNETYLSRQKLLDTKTIRALGDTLC